jgi:hypothetical protein
MLTAASGQKADKVSRKKLAISGTVKGMDQKPVAGAQIYVDSVYTGITTDDSGKFTIKVSPGAKSIFVYSPSQTAGEAAIDERSTVDLTLDSKLVDKPSFIGKSGKENKTANSEKKKKPNTYTDIYQMIRQEVSGVLVSGRSIVVQQPNSFFGSASPLFVVNGVRVSSIDYINPFEVKSIQLLKGSYANIYGTEGANGVISITLNSGSEK